MSNVASPAPPDTALTNHSRPTPFNVHLDNRNDGRPSKPTAAGLVASSRSTSHPGWCSHGFRHSRKPSPSTYSGGLGTRPIFVPKPPVFAWKRLAFPTTPARSLLPVFGLTMRPERGLGAFRAPLDKLGVTGSSPVPPMKSPKNLSGWLHDRRLGRARAPSEFLVSRVVVDDRPPLPTGRRAGETGPEYVGTPARVACSAGVRVTGRQRTDPSRCSRPTRTLRRESGRLRASARCLTSSLSRASSVASSCAPICLAQRFRTSSKSLPPTAISSWPWGVTRIRLRRASLGSASRST